MRSRAPRRCAFGARGLELAAHARLRAAARLQAADQSEESPAAEPGEQEAAEPSKEPPPPQPERKERRQVSRRPRRRAWFGCQLQPGPYPACPSPRPLCSQNGKVKNPPPEEPAQTRLRLLCPLSMAGGLIGKVGRGACAAACGGAWGAGRAGQPPRPAAPAGAGAVAGRWLAPDAPAAARAPPRRRRERAL